MTAGAARLSGRRGAHARGAVAGFGSGLVAVAVGAPSVSATRGRVPRRGARVALSAILRC